MLNWFSRLFRVRVTEERTTTELIVNGDVVMIHIEYKTWWHGVNPRVESYNVTKRANDGKVLKDFDFHTYSDGLIALGCDVEMKTHHTERESD